MKTTGKQVRDFFGYLKDQSDCCDAAIVSHSDASGPAWLACSKCHERLDVVALNSVLLGDCLDVMKSMGNNSVDLLVTDPPYGLGEDGRRGTRRAKRTNGNEKWVNTVPIKHTAYGWDSARPSKEYFDEMIRVSKNQIIFGGNYFSDLLPQSNGWIFWDKKASGDFSRGELIYTSFNKGTRMYEHLWNGFRQMAGLVEKRQHPTQKPLRLMEWILTDYAKQGDVIFDPFAGSGTTLVAAAKLNFSYIGVENQQEYHQVIIDRLAKQPHTKIGEGLL